jgi:predicted DNA repair protein MutK
LGLDTSNAIGCFITVLVLLPVAIMLALLIATITIVTCLNLGGCFEKIAEQILENIVQRLTPPDS